MALWHRINQSKLKFLSHQFWRYYVQTPHASLSKHTVKKPSSCALASPVSDVCRRSTNLCDNVRFFATSFQAKAKKDEKANGGKLLNDEIKAPFVRLVTGEEHFVVSLHEARERAMRLNLDLVQVQGNVDPPVCKIMDFKREQYKRKMQEKDRVKEKKDMTLKKGSFKEVRFLEKTELKDLKMKADSVVRLMQRGYRVKCMAVGIPKKGGRALTPVKGSGENLTEEEIAEIRRQEEEAEKERLKEVLSRLVALLGDEYVLESGPRAEKKQAYVVVRHAKFGPKKGGAKKSKDAGKVSTSQSGSIGSSAMVEDDSVESGMETEDENLSDEDDENAWSVADSVDDFDSVFDVKDAVKEPSLNYGQNIHVSPSVDSSGTNMGLPSSPQQPFEAENRYKRSSPTLSRDNRAPRRIDSSTIPPPQFSNQSVREQFPSSPPRDFRAPGRIDSSRIPPPQFSNHTGKTQSAMNWDNRSPGRIDSSRIPPPQFSNHTGQTQSTMNLSPATGERKPMQKQPNAPDTPTNAPDIRLSSYGIFSNPKASTPGKPGVASEVNKNANSTGGVGGGQGPKDDGTQQPRWGIFSKDGPNVNPNRISK